jgi:hypothetical protein
MTATISTQQEWFSNYVSATMSILGVHEPDADGDLAVSGETCLAWVRTETSEPWGVRVFALAARDVPLKAAVYKEVNAANTADRAMRVVLAANGSVMVDYLLLADAVNTDNLRAVIGRVLTVADQLGPMITAVHGGTTPIVPEPFDPEG